MVTKMYRPHIGKTKSFIVEVEAGFCIFTVYRNKCVCEFKPIQKGNMKLVRSGLAANTVCHQ